MNMRISLGQTQSQQQKQILTQRLIQSMEILQLPIQQLEDRIKAEVDANPFLESLTDESESEPDENSRNEPAEDDSGEFEDLDETDFNSFDDEPIRSRSQLEEDAQNHQDLISSTASQGETLQEHLLAQISWFDLTDCEKAACEMIIGNLDHDGLLTVQLDELWGENADETEKGIWQTALKTVQSMDPPGVGARSVSERLLLQVTDQTPHHEIIRLILERYFAPDVSKKVSLIARETGYTKEEIEKGLAEISKLNPHPGSDFDDRIIPSVVPDLYVYKGEDGRWEVDINDGNRIRLGINSEYKEMLREKETDRETKDFIRKHIGQGEWFIEAIRQRRMTLLRVGQAIVRHQSDFFDFGPERLRPLKMQQIADELGVDISTVSRACSDKWLTSEIGIYPLKSFFSGAIPSGSDELSASAVKSRIKEMIDREEKQNPLSDEEITARLKKERIEISRRAVAKYRDELRIPNSRDRKERR